MTEELKAEIRDAAKLHGHLGPFLVIGVRIGIAARKSLKLENHENGKAWALVEVPLRTPFSCTLDGIQATTHCTIGNQRLKVRKSPRKISARFVTADETLTVTVNPEIVKEVKEQISKGATNESLAETIASTPESRLLSLDMTKERR